MIKLFFIFAVFFQVSFAGTVFKRQATPGAQCPKIETVTTFEAERYLGSWYSNQGIPTFFQPSGTRCVEATYGSNADGTISVHNNAVFSNNSFTEICGFAQVKNPEDPGKLSVTFPNSPPGSYNVLDTDYTNFSAVYSCAEIPNIGKVENAWLLTRERTPSKELVECGLKAFTSRGISLDKFEVIDQGESCIYESPDGVSCAKN